MLLPTVKPLLLLSGMLVSSWSSGDDHNDTAKNDRRLHQVTQDGGERREDPHILFLQRSVVAHPAVDNTDRENWFEHGTELDPLDSKGKGSIWSTDEGDSTPREGGENTWSRNEGDSPLNQREEEEEDIWSVDEEDVGVREVSEILWSRVKRDLAARTKVDRGAEEGSGQVDQGEELQVGGALDLERMRQTLKLKSDMDSQRLGNSKEERRKRKRLQQEKKLRKTLQEELKRKNRLMRIIMNSRAGRRRPPNIIFILADDLGYNDVPWHNPDIKAPELLRLARKGVVLENHYVLPLCAPSRAALLTGIYPFRYGKQASSSPLSPTGLNTSLTLLPERLKNLGYKTHLVGKWHLGYCNVAYTPTKRGFDSFYGFYLGSQTYFSRYKKLSPKKGSPFWLQKNEVTDDHDPFRYPSPSLEDDLKRLELGTGSSSTSEEEEERRNQIGQQWLTPEHMPDGGFDFRFNNVPLYNTTGVYSNELFAARAEEVIRDHGASGATKNPLFLLLSLQAVHGPVEVPLKYKRRHKNVKNLNRRTFHGMVSALDEVVGRVVTQLKRSGLYENSIIVFTTDNGGNIRSGGNNFPLRGSKGSLYEGGTRGVAFIHSPLLPRTGYKYTGLMHVVDWYKTLLYVAEGHPFGHYDHTLQQDARHLEDFPQWVRSLSLTADDAEETDNELDGGEEEEEEEEDQQQEQQKSEADGMNLWPAIVRNSESPRVSFVYNVRKRPLRGAIRRRNWKLVVGSGGRYDGWVPPSDVAGGVSTRCCSTWHTRTNPNDVILYNLKDDPLETTDVAALRPDVVLNLKARLRSYAYQSRNPHSPRDDPRGHPSLYGGFFSPGWCQPIV